MPRRKVSFLPEDKKPGIKLAAAYVRMSTEHQQYSTENQLETIKLFALEKGYEITKIYTDSGKSGLTIRGRKGLQQLFKDISSLTFDYQIILVYDVSRWGRFQDPDVSASYEVRCRQAGVAVEYCAEQFVNDGSPISSILKSVKRMMAGEYSRELSVKVFAGQARLITLGFTLGGAAGYGYRRQLVDQSGQAKAVLSIGERKSLQTDRVILIPGPDSEQKIVREIYRLFTEELLRVGEIARKLNDMGILWRQSTPWNSSRVYSVLKNEKYIGNNVWNKTSAKLKELRKINPECEWVRGEKAFAPLIDEQTFLAAQSVFESRSFSRTNEQLIEDLRAILRRHGYLSAILLRADKRAASCGQYVARFGGLLRAFELAGYKSGRDYSYFAADRRVRCLAISCLESVIETVRSYGAEVCVNTEKSIFTINDELRVSLTVVRYKPSRFLKYQWQVRLNLEQQPDLNLVVRMQPGETQVKDYLVIPTAAIVNSKLNIKEGELRDLEQYRFDNLDVIGALVRRTSISGGKT